jgi:hypothetical protein
MLEVLIRPDVNALVQWTELGVPESPQLGMLFSIREPLLEPLFKLRHFARLESIGTHLVDHSPSYAGEIFWSRPQASDCVAEASLAEGSG